MDILQLYATASGQLINFEKSLIYFSSNKDGGQRNWIKTQLNIREVDWFETYLGLPTLIGHSKYQAFAVLKDKVRKKLQRWKGIMLSRARKEVLIKAVAQSLPTYTMGVFQLPMKLCDKLNAMCAKFLWGQVGNERKIHWKSWESLSKPKKEGGMGFRDIHYFNLAMLAKQRWRLLKESDTLFYRCFKMKYFLRCNFLEAGDVPNSFYVWKSIMAAQLILKKGSCWRVGYGSGIRVLKDKWIPNRPTNREGEVMAAMAARGPPVSGSEEAEVLACCKALEFAVDAGFTELLVEGDNVSVMQTILRSRLNWSRLGHLYEDKKHLCAGLRVVSVGWVGRTANGVAHCLTQFAYGLVDEIVWLEESPPPALDALYLDLLKI